MMDNIIEGKFRLNRRRKRDVRAQANRMSVIEPSTEIEDGRFGDREQDPYLSYHPTSLKAQAFSWLKKEWDATRLCPPVTLGMVAAGGAYGVAGTPDIVGGDQTAVIVQYVFVFIALYQIAKLSFRNIFLPLIAFFLTICVMNNTLPVAPPEGAALVYVQLGMIAIVIGFGCRCLDLGHRAELR